MRYEMRVTAYDVVDQVQVVVMLEKRQKPGIDPIREVLACTVFAGQGMDDPFQWCKDALIAAIEAL